MDLLKTSCRWLIEIGDLRGFNMMNLLETVPLDYPGFKFWVVGDSEVDGGKKGPFGGICDSEGFKGDGRIGCINPRIVNCHDCREYMSPEMIFAFLDMTHKHGPINWVDDNGKPLEYDEHGEIISDRDYYKFRKDNE